MYRMKVARDEVEDKRLMTKEKEEFAEAPTSFVDEEAAAHHSFMEDARLSQLNVVDRAQEGHPYPLIPKPGEGALPRLPPGMPYQGAGIPVGGSVFGTHPIDRLELSQATSVASHANSAPGALATPGVIPLVPQYTDASYWRVT
jgi:hypothetical protein